MLANHHTPSDDVEAADDVNPSQPTQEKKKKKMKKKLSAAKRRRVEIFQQSIKQEKEERAQRKLLANSTNDGASASKSYCLNRFDDRDLTFTRRIGSRPQSGRSF